MLPIFSPFFPCSVRNRDLRRSLHCDLPLKIVKLRRSFPCSFQTYLCIFRFKQEQQGCIDALYGNQEWRRGIDIPDATERYKFFADTYAECLKANGATYTCCFPVRNRKNHLLYCLIFAASGPHAFKAFKEMKEAFNRISVKTDALAFSGYNIG